MKKLSIFIYLFCLISYVCSGQEQVLQHTGQQLSAKTDERIELTGAVFRLAGIPEYKEGYITEYNSDIDSCFSDFRFGELTAYIVRLRNEEKLGYGSVAASALCLKIEDGKVKIDDDINLSERLGFGYGWKDEKTFRKYVRLLNDFYVKSDFHSFYENHRPLYEQAIAGMDDVLQYFNTEWFGEFFGIKRDMPNIYVAMGHGKSNYSVGDANAIIIGGQVQYSVEMLYPIVHETCHGYSNPMFLEYWPQMKEASEEMYPYVADIIAQYGYDGAFTAMMEWLNDLFSLMYYRDNLQFIGERMVSLFALVDPDIKLNEDILKTMFITPKCNEMTERGFIWFPRSVQFMENFYLYRDIYPHINSFMPQLAAFVNDAARNYDRIKFEFEHRRPYIVNMFPANGSNIWEEKADEIRITFSKPMSNGIYSTGRNFDDDELEILPLAETDDENLSDCAYWADDRTYVLKIDRSSLEKDKKYGLRLHGAFFVASDYNRMEEDYWIIYNTNTKQK